MNRVVAFLLMLVPVLLAPAAVEGRKLMQAEAPMIAPMAAPQEMTPVDQPETPDEPVTAELPADEPEVNPPSSSEPASPVEELPVPSVADAPVDPVVEATPAAAEPAAVEEPVAVEEPAAPVEDPAVEAAPADPATPAMEENAPAGDMPVEPAGALPADPVAADASAEPATEPVVQEAPVDPVTPAMEASPVETAAETTPQEPAQVAPVDPVVEEAVQGPDAEPVLEDEAGTAGVGPENMTPEAETPTTAGNPRPNLPMMEFRNANSRMGMMNRFGEQ